MTDLSQLLARQADNLQQLQQQLATELRLISSRDAEAIINLVEQKQQLLDDIQGLDEQIKHRLTPQDASPVTLSDEQRQQIAGIQQQVKECQYQTEINQTAVEQGQLRLEHLKHLLIESRAKESLTYDKAGKASGGGKGKSVSA